MIHHLSKENSLMSNYLAEIRDEGIQKDSMRFRRNIERIGEILGYEVSKVLDYEEQEITTPLGKAQCNLLARQPVIVSILRAGLTMHHGVLNAFDKAENAFISAFRKYHKDDSFEIEIEYLSSPSLEGKTVLLCDPMIATGASMVLAYKALLERGTPEKVHVLSIIASDEGIQHVKKNMPENTEIWMADIDKELTAHSYIVPGLGDAGDLAYGSKI